MKLPRLHSLLRHPRSSRTLVLPTFLEAFASTSCFQGSSAFKMFGSACNDFERVVSNSRICYINRISDDDTNIGFLDTLKAHLPQWNSPRGSGCRPNRPPRLAHRTTPTDYPSIFGQKQIRRKRINHRALVHCIWWNRVTTDSTRYSG